MNLETPAAFYAFLKESNQKVLSNIIFAGSPGHQVSELDYFLRKLHAHEIPSDRRYLWIQRAGNITESMIELFGDHFRRYNLGMVAHDALYHVAAQTLRMRPDLGVDVGLSHIKNAWADYETARVGAWGDETYYFVSNDAVVAAYMDYYRLRKATKGFTPWNDAKPKLDDAFLDFVGGDTSKLVVVHFRKSIGNAGVNVPAENMFPTLEFLRDNGFNIVKGGTEPYPEEFERFGVINYTNSPFRNFRNDLALMCNARLAVINASGLENIRECMDLPTVSYSRWHLTMTPSSEKSVVVPTLLYDPRREQLLSFPKHMLFFKTRPDCDSAGNFGWHFPIGQYFARVPQGDEILAGVQEALELADQSKPLTPLQAEFNALDGAGVLSLVENRVSNFFLERFQSLM